MRNHSRRLLVASSVMSLLKALSDEVKSNSNGYTVKVFNNLFDMDDINLFAKQDLMDIFNNLKCFRDFIGMDVGVCKCAKVIFKKGKITETRSIDLDFFTKIRKLEQEAYKYLGHSEGDGIQYKQMEEKQRKEYYRSVRLELNTS